MMTKRTEEKQKESKDQSILAGRQSLKKHETNQAFASNSDGFKKACEKAGIPATSRQASKFRNKCGLAYKGL